MAGIFFQRTPSTCEWRSVQSGGSTKSDAPAWSCMMSYKDMISGRVIRTLWARDIALDREPLSLACGSAVGCGLEVSLGGDMFMNVVSSWPRRLLPGNELEESC